MSATEINPETETMIDGLGLDDEAAEVMKAALRDLTARRERQAAEAEKLARRREAVAAVIAASEDGEGDGNTETITLFAARMNDDLTEGKGGIRIAGYFLFREDAKAVSVALEGVMGTANTVPVGELVVHLDVQSFLGAPPENSHKLFNPQRKGELICRLDAEAAER